MRHTRRSERGNIISLAVQTRLGGLNILTVNRNASY
jgi:hypothetical protein